MGFGRRMNDVVAMLIDQLRAFGALSRESSSDSQNKDWPF
jgi:hypothetical protein